MSIVFASDTQNTPPIYTPTTGEEFTPRAATPLVPTEFDLQTAFQDREDLPDYSSLRASESNNARSSIVRARPVPPPPKEYDYKISGGGKDIVTFTLFTNARHSRHAPTLLGSDPVAGTVRLRLDKPTTIKSVSITICGRCLPTVGFYVDTNSFSDENTFMEILHTLWSAEEDSRGPDMISGGITRDGKLQGEYLWSYAIKIPPTLTAPTPGGEVSFVPPQTFKEQYCAMVVYDVLLRVKRKWPIPDYKIEVPFHYIPAISPSAFPDLRHLAYAQGTPLLSPHIDPDGWHALSDIQLTGTLFKSRPLDVECTLCLAKPLQYTRGTEIPVYMRISSHSSQAVDILSSEATTAFTVRLRRRVKLSALTKSRSKLSSMALDTGSRIQDILGARAVWWPSTTAADSTLVSGKYIRYIRGELRLKDDLKPSSVMPYMRIEYAVVIRPFTSVTGIELDGANEKIIQEQPVEIGTLYGPGPVPKRYVPL